MPFAYSGSRTAFVVVLVNTNTQHAGKKRHGIRRRSGIQGGPSVWGAYVAAGEVLRTRDDKRVDEVRRVSGGLCGLRTRVQSLHTHRKEGVEVAGLLDAVANARQLVREVLTTRFRGIKIALNGLQKQEECVSATGLRS